MIILLRYITGCGVRTEYIYISCPSCEILNFIVHINIYTIIKGVFMFPQSV